MPQIVEQFFIEFFFCGSIKIKQKYFQQINLIEGLMKTDARKCIQNM